MKVRLFLVSSLCLLSAGAMAQSEFRPGYVVPLSGDTVRGLVDNRNGYALSRQIRFKASADASVTEYKPAELRAAGFTPGSRFEPQPLNGAPTLLAVLAKGPASLYRYADANDKLHYYVLSAKQPLTELIQRDTVEDAMVNGVMRSVKTRYYPFRQVLATSFADCFTLTKDIASAELSESRLQRLFNDYYACKGVNTGNITAIRKTSLQIGLLGGVDNIKMSANGRSGGKQVELASGWQPIVGLSLTLRPGSFNEKITLVAEALYHKMSADYYAERSGAGISTAGTTKTTIQVSWKDVRVPLLFRYTLVNRGAVRPFFQLGPQATLRLNASGSYSTKEEIPGFPVGGTVDNFEIKGLGLGGTVGAGLQVALGRAGSVRVEGRYGRTDNVAANSTVSGEDMLSLLLGYTFGQ